MTHRELSLYLQQDMAEDAVVGEEKDNGGVLMMYGYGKGMARGFGFGRGSGPGRDSGAGFGFRGTSPSWPYTGKGRGGLPRCSYPGSGRNDIPDWDRNAGYKPSVVVGSEKEVLKDQAEMMKEHLVQIEKRLRELEEKEVD